MNRTPELARRLFDRFEPIHAVTYFAPESRDTMDALGFRGFWSGYFAGRAAPLDPAPAPVVTALFYNFSAERVAKSLAAGRAAATAAEALAARAAGAVAALRTYGLAEHQNLDTAAELTGKAARTAPVDGRALFAANAALPWPESPLEALWHATTLLREHRGDGHIAALVAAGIGGRESNVLHCAAGTVPVDFIMRTRDYDDAEWRACTERLHDRGLLDDHGSLTDAGRELKSDVEAATDRAALTALDALDDDEIEALFGALTPLTRLVVAAGAVPAVTPMGLRRNELDDDSAHLR